MERVLEWVHLDILVFVILHFLDIIVKLIIVFRVVYSQITQLPQQLYQIKVKFL